MRTIINVAIGQGYERGQQRLADSIERHSPTEFMRWHGWPPWAYTKESNYTCKAAAFQAALDAGRKLILWLDASVVVTGPLDPIFAHAERHGVYLPTSGWNCAQSCNDRILEYFQIDRDTAETIPDAATGCFAINTDHEVGSMFIQMFIQAGKDGQFNGSRLHDNQSKDPRFLFHRQDQSAAGLIAYHLGIQTQHFGGLCGYWGQPHDGSQVVHFKGIE